MVSLVWSRRFQVWRELPLGALSERGEQLGHAAYVEGASAVEWLDRTGLCEVRRRARPQLLHQRAVGRQSPHLILAHASNSLLLVIQLSSR